MYFIKTINHSLYFKAIPELKNVKSSEELYERLNSKKITMTSHKHIANTLYLIKKDLHRYALTHIFTNGIVAILSTILFVLFAIKGEAPITEYLYVFIITAGCSIINKMLESNKLKLSNLSHRKLLLVSFITLNVIVTGYMFWIIFNRHSSIFTYLPLVILLGNTAYFIRYFIKLEDDIYEEDPCGFRKQQLRTNLERGFTLVWATNLFFVAFTGTTSATSSLSHFFFFLFIITSIATVYHTIHYKFLHKIKSHHLA